MILAFKICRRVAIYKQKHEDLRNEEICIPAGITVLAVLQQAMQTEELVCCCVTLQSCSSAPPPPGGGMRDWGAVGRSPVLRSPTGVPPSPAPAHPLVPPCLQYSIVARVCPDCQLCSQSISAAISGTAGSSASQFLLSRMLGDLQERLSSLRAGWRQAVRGAPPRCHSLTGRQTCDW